MADQDRRPDEETPLLQGKSKTPLPWGQIFLVLIALVAEPISSAYILPFINQLIGELGITGGDDRKIGYYAGLIESLFFVTQALTTWQWSRLSDFIGRRPVILTGLLGLSASNIAFGLSRTLPTLMMSRCIAGILNGNVGVMKSFIGDVTDHSNMAQVFSLLAPSFCLGFTVAPLYGGALTKPQERWPHIFQGEFWATYPYFLPSLVSGCFTLTTFSICAIFLKESLPSKTGKQPQSEGSLAEHPSCNSLTNDDGQPVPISSLLKTYTVRIIMANYGILGLLSIGILVLLPLFYSSPIEIGGLGFPPPVIGTFLSIFGVVDCSVQALFGARLIQHFGPKKVFCCAVFSFYPAILLFPIISAVVAAQGTVGPVVRVLLVIQLLLMVIADLGFPVIAIFVTRAAPNNRSLGSVNGLAQSAVSISRAIGPALMSSLFALSKEYNVLGGNLVYVVLAMFATTLVTLSRRLPDLNLRDDQ